MTDLEEGGMPPPTVEAISQSFRSSVKGVVGAWHGDTGCVARKGPPPKGQLPLRRDFAI